MRIRSFPYVVTAVVAALALPTAALANPSAETPQTAAAAELAANSWETDTSPVTLSVYVDSPTQLRLTTFWGIDPVSVRWQEDTGIDLEWVIAPDDSQAKLNVLIASGDLPDLIHLSQELPQIRQLADNGLAWNIRETVGEPRSRRLGLPLGAQQARHRALPHAVRFDGPLHGAVPAPGAGLLRQPVRDSCLSGDDRPGRDPRRRRQPQGGQHQRLRGPAPHGQGGASGSHPRAVFAQRQPEPRRRSPSSCSPPCRSPD